MAKVEEIYWRSYQEYEGPFYGGKVKFKLPKDPTVQDKYLAAIVAIESGHYDAINMYDRMIVSVGLIQFGEANIFSVTKLIGSICDAGKEAYVQECLKPGLQISNSTFRKNHKGIWRFFMGDMEVNSLALQHTLFLGCDGRKGSWTPETKLRAKTWAACFATILENLEICEIQKKFTEDRLYGFLTAEAKKVLFDDKTTSPWADATRAIYLTYAINAPRIAGDMLVATKFVGEKWSQEWCLSLIKKLTFGPNIKIYPIRYDAVRPVIESMFGVELPKTAVALDSLKILKSDVQPKAEPPVQSAPPAAINKELIKELNAIVLAPPVKLEKNPSFLGFLFDMIKKVFSLFRK